MENLLEISVIETEKPNAEEMTAKIYALEDAILKEAQVEIPVTHHFAPGIYMREMFIPKGVVLTGAVHKTEHLNILSQGEISVWTDQGMKRLTACSVIKSNPGIKRAGFAHEDSIWITVHSNPTEERDPQKLWELFVQDPYVNSLEFKKASQESINVDADLPKLEEGI